MIKTCVSCLLAIFVLVVVCTLVWRTVKQESARPSAPVVGTLAEGPGSKLPVRAFTTTEMLGDYLLAAADHDTTSEARITGLSGAITLPAGTKVLVQGISGPGQARIEILTGAYKGKILYVNYATISPVSPPSQEPGS